MNFHTAEAGYELDREIAILCGVEEKFLSDDGGQFEGSVLAVDNSELARVFGEGKFVDAYGLFDARQSNNPINRFRPSTLWPVTKLVVDKLGFWLGFTVFQSPYGDRPYVGDIGHKMPLRKSFSPTVEAPTLELLFCRAIGVVHWRDRVGPTGKLAAAKSVEINPQQLQGTEADAAAVEAAPDVPGSIVVPDAAELKRLGL